MHESRFISEFPTYRVLILSREQQKLSYFNLVHYKLIIFKTTIYKLIPWDPTLGSPIFPLTFSPSLPRDSQKMASSQGRHAKMKVVIDCDAGIDDAQAIMIALSHEVDILAITCTFGNVDVDQVSKNVLKILDVCGRTDIPVYKGAHQAMLGTVVS